MKHENIALTFSQTVQTTLSESKHTQNVDDDDLSLHGKLCIHTTANTIGESYSSSFNVLTTIHVYSRGSR